MSDRIIITGGTGFVGQNVLRAMAFETRQVVCTSRDPERASSAHPECEWAQLDVDDEASIERLLRKGDRVVFLIHGMSGGAGYAQREEASAAAFGRIAHAAGVSRIVYLGGPKPPGEPSEHLASRLRTGVVLRESGVSTIELRAGMIMGAGSESWRITRDLAARLPVMLLPKWLKNRCEPIFIDDVVAAILHALDAPAELAGAWDLPGPQRLTYAEVLAGVAKASGMRPYSIPVPLLSPRLSSHWLRLVTRADMRVARELVDGLKYDLVSPDDGYFAHMEDYVRTPFEVAVRGALWAEKQTLSLGSAIVEALVRRLSRAPESDGAQ